ncbi:hypothetical protein C8J56DRAFT_1086441 [Mycena floridula]|nr:hypothetical protein C8J56DRAFT_1086441 [Mycena floridula]
MTITLVFLLMAQTIIFDLNKVHGLNNGDTFQVRAVTDIGAYETDQTQFTYDKDSQNQDSTNHSGLLYSLPDKAAHSKLVPGLAARARSHKFPSPRPVRGHWWSQRRAPRSPRAVDGVDSVDGNSELTDAEIRQVTADLVAQTARLELVEVEIAVLRHDLESSEAEKRHLQHIIAEDKLILRVIRRVPPDILRVKNLEGCCIDLSNSMVYNDFDYNLTQQKFNLLGVQLRRTADNSLDIHIGTIRSLQPLIYPLLPTSPRWRSLSILLPYDISVLSGIVASTPQLEKVEFLCNAPPPAQLLQQQSFVNELLQFFSILYSVEGDLTLLTGCHLVWRRIYSYREYRARAIQIPSRHRFSGLAQMINLQSCTLYCNFNPGSSSSVSLPNLLHLYLDGGSPRNIIIVLDALSVPRLCTLKIAELPIDNSFTSLLPRYSALKGLHIGSCSLSVFGISFFSLSVGGLTSMLHASPNLTALVLDLLDEHVEFVDHLVRTPAVGHALTFLVFAERSIPEAVTSRDHGTNEVGSPTGKALSSPGGKGDLKKFQVRTAWDSLEGGPSLPNMDLAVAAHDERDRSSLYETKKREQEMLTDAKIWIGNANKCKYGSPEKEIVKWAIAIMGLLVNPPTSNGDKQGASQK